MPIRIALVFNRYRRDGGTERITGSVVESLSQEVQWYVLTRRWGGHRPANVRLIKCRVWALGRAWRLLAFARAVTRRLARLDVDLVQSQIFIQSADIYRADGGAFAEWIGQRRRQGGRLQRLMRFISPYTRLKLRMERQMYTSPRLKAVICNSAMVRDDIRRCFPNTRARLTVIDNGVNLSQFEPTDERRRQGQMRRTQLGLRPNDTVLVFVGSGFERKGLAAAMRGLAASPTEAHLLVVGRDSRMRRYQRLARRLGVADRVHFPGAQADVRPWLWSADALIHPALYEAFGLVIIEALAAGLPVLASHKTGAALAAVEQGKTGYRCDALDIDALAQAITAIDRQDGPTRAAWQVRCQAAARPFSLQRMRRQLLDFYQRMPT